MSSEQNEPVIVDVPDEPEPVLDITEEPETINHDFDCANPMTSVDIIECFFVPN